jgi:5-formyltetrahydrofolate cyclo-ligase
MTIHLTKAQIRQAHLAQRKHLTQQFIVHSSQKINALIQSLAVFQQAQHLAWYMPVSGEVDLSSSWNHALQLGKSCYFPAIQPNQTVIFLPYTAQTELRLNRYHIPEPVIHVESAQALEKLDIIFLPVVAFDMHRYRLGMGKGYYDKTLAHINGPMLIGVAYEWQKQSRLPHEPWDIPLTMIVTEDKIYS